MKKPNYRPKLDIVLECLRNYNVEIMHGGLITQLALSYNLDFRNNPSDFKRIIKKLELDRFITVDKENYFITLDGYYFKGYVKANKNHLRKNRLASFREWTLSIGTGLAGLYGLFEISKWCYHHFQWMHVLKFWH